MNNACAARSMSLVIVFALLAAIAVAAVSTVLMATLGNSGGRAIEEKAVISTKEIGAVLGDPFAMGEYDHMEQILNVCKMADPDLAWATVVSSDGRIVASTDASKKGSMLNGSQKDKSALAVKDLTLNPSETDPNILDTAIPIRTSGGQAGILRMGYSLQRASTSIGGTTTTVCVVAFLAVLVCTLIFAGIAKNWVPSTPGRTGCHCLSVGAVRSALVVPAIALV